MKRAEEEIDWEQNDLTHDINACEICIPFQGKSGDEGVDREEIEKMWERMWKPFNFQKYMHPLHLFVN